MSDIAALFSRTSRENPAEFEAEGQNLLIRAGYLHSSADGFQALLAPGAGSLQRIETVIREELQAMDAQEIHCTENYFEDPDPRYFPEVRLSVAAAELTQWVIRSYRQLPIIVYTQRRGRSAVSRTRAGLLQPADLVAIQGSYFCANAGQGETLVNRLYAGTNRIMARLGLPVIPLESACGGIAFACSHPCGEDRWLVCDACGYTSDRRRATFRKSPPQLQQSLSLIKIATPHVSSIAGLAGYLQIPEAQTAKAVFFSADLPGRETPAIIFVLVRGDMEVNESKLMQALPVRNLRPAKEDEIRRIGAVPGYTSPIGLAAHPDLIVIADDLIPSSPNLVAGANEDGYHYLHTCYGRDYIADLVVDLVYPHEGDSCPHCGGALQIQRGVIVAGVESPYPEQACTYQSQNGKNLPVQIGSFYFHPNRILGCLAEVYHDERGLCLPAEAAPYQIHLVILPGRQVDTLQKAQELLPLLEAQGWSILVDGRPDSAGVKFKDADLIGAPIRLTLSEKTLAAETIEYKQRAALEHNLVPLADLVDTIRRDLGADRTDTA